MLGTMARSRSGWVSVLVLAAIGGGCGGGGTTPPIGEDTFESAGFAGSAPSDGRGAADAGAAAPDDSAGEGGARTVEEADLYRFVGDKLYVLNQYRGLFVFDVTDPDHPVELGRMPLVGYPVEMYVRGDRAYAIISDYFTYWHDAVAIEAGLLPVYGSRIVGIDLSNPEQPVEIGDVVLDGYVSDTRLVGDVIYAVANRYAYYRHWGAPETETRDQLVITSIDIADPTRMREVQQETIDGQGWFVHATPEAFLVAGNVWSDGWTHSRTEVQYVDITDPAGTMALRGRIQVDGQIQDDTALHVHAGQLRLLTRSWDDSTTKLRIFDATAPDTLPLLGELDYYYDGGLFGTTFDGNRLYMIHYMRIDPLEVVDLSDPTAPYIAGILEMPGWVDRIAALGDRLIGLGIDDTDGRRVSVSLFDVSNPATPTLLDRVSTGDEWSWSSATWERKAWTVDEAAGVILFPYSGWSTDGREYHNALGILEFDRSTLTPRGEVEATAPVERGAIHEGRVYALSQATLQVVDIRDLAAPRATATIELARNVTGYARTARAGVELVQPGIYGWYGYGSAGPTSVLRTTPLAQPDGPAEMARLELPRTVQSVLVHGDLAIALKTYDDCGWYYDGRGDYGCDTSSRPGVVVASVADPASPSIVANLDLPTSVAASTGYGTVGDGYVSSYTYYRERYGDAVGGWQGGRPALDLGGGRFALIRTTSVSCSGLEACRSASIEPVRSGEGSYEYYWGYRYENALVIVDVSDPSRPAVRGPYDLGEGNVEHAFVDGATLVYSHARPSRVDGEGRSWVRYYMERFRIGGDGSLRRLASINVPGIVVALRDGGTTALTLDRSWGAERSTWGGYRMESWLNALAIDGTRAVRTSVLRVGEDLASMTVTASGSAYLVRSRYDERATSDGYYYGELRSSLATIDVSDRNALAETSEIALGSTWWDIAATTDDTLALSGGYGGGLALFDIGTDAGFPAFERFVRTQGWSVSILEEGDDLFLSGGPYGIQRVSLAD